MRKLLGSVLMLAMFTSPLLAATRKPTVNIPDSASIGSTVIAAGEYKLAYDGPGPAVKVTLTRSGEAPIVLDAKLAAGNGQPSVTYSVENGVRTLHEIDLGKLAFHFDAPETAGQ